MSRGSNVHEQSITHCAVFRLVHSLEHLASMITWKISQYHNTGIPANRASSVVI